MFEIFLNSDCKFRKFKNTPSYLRLRVWILIFLTFFQKSLWTFCFVKLKFSPFKGHFIKWKLHSSLPKMTAKVICRGGLMPKMRHKKWPFFYRYFGTKMRLFFSSIISPAAFSYQEWIYFDPYCYIYLIWTK